MSRKQMGKLRSKLSLQYSHTTFIEFPRSPLKIPCTVRFKLAPKSTTVDPLPSTLFVH
jgi:hypothetical protein